MGRHPPTGLVSSPPGKVWQNEIILNKNLTDSFSTWARIISPHSHSYFQLAKMIFGNSWAWGSRQISTQPAQAWHLKTMSLQHWHTEGTLWMHWMKRFLFGRHHSRGKSAEVIWTISLVMRKWVSLKEKGFCCWGRAPQAVPLGTEGPCRHHCHHILTHCKNCEGLRPTKTNQ